MGYAQTFKGSFTFADAHCLEVGLDGFLESDPEDHEQSALDLDDLVREGLTISVDWDGHAPASCAFGTETALRKLGDHAQRGVITTSFTMDTTERGRVTCSKRKSSQGLPPRHHRWEMYFAALADDAKALRAIAAQGVSLDVRYDKLRDVSPLHIAAQAGSDAAVAALLDLGIAVDVLARDRSPLFVAGTVAVAKRLLAAGARVDLVDGDSSPLASAITREDFEVASLLFDAGGTIPKSGAVGVCESLAEGKQLALLTALCARDKHVAAALKKPIVMFRAIQGGEPVVVDYLLQHGARLPKDLLEQAIGSRSVPLVELALRDAAAVKQNAASNRYKDAMCRAASEGSLEVMDALLAAGLPVSPAKKGETSPLHCGAAERHGSDGDVLAWLLRHGANLEAIDRDGRTPLAKAIWLGSHAASKALLLAGASVDTVANVTDDEMAAFRRAVGKLAPPVKKAEPTKAPPAKAAPKKPAKAAPKKPAKAKPAAASKTKAASKAKTKAASKTKAKAKAKTKAKTKTKTKAKAKKR